MNVPHIQVPIPGIIEQKKAGMPHAAPMITVKANTIIHRTAYPIPRIIAPIIRAIKLMHPVIIHKVQTINPSPGTKARHKETPTQIRKNAITKINVVTGVSNPTNIIPADITTHRQANAIVTIDAVIMAHMQAKIPQINIMAVTPKHRINRAKTRAVTPHNTTNRAKQATIRANGIIKAQITPNNMARNVITNAKTIPIAPNTSRQRNRAGEHTTREQMQDKMKMIRHIDPAIIHIAPITDRMRHIIDRIAPNPQKITEIMNIMEQIRQIANKTITEIQVIMNSMTQSPHPTTIAKMITARIMITIVLIMQRIIGTTTKPNQFRKMAGT